MRTCTSNVLAALTTCLVLGTATSCAVPQSPGDDDVAAASNELRVCAAGPTVNGIDVSHWDGMVDWSAVAGSGVRFSFIKATQGTSFTDDTFARNWSETRRVGVLRGAYHFFCPKMNGTDQADHFLRVMGTMAADDLPPVLDVESCSTAVCGSACDWSGVSCGTIATNIQRFVDRVAAVTGRTPMIYSGVGSWDGPVCGSTDFADLPLWVANYGVTCPAVPAAWSDWQFWQTGDAGRVPGITSAVDMNVFNGDMAALRAFVGAAAPPPPTPACGDGTCAASESCTSCASDCGACPPTVRCGDGTCSASESCTSCASDCGACPPTVRCGDGTCSASESCTSCASDCGACPVAGRDAGMIIGTSDAGVPVRPGGDGGPMAPVAPRLERSMSGAMSGSCGCSAPGTSGGPVGALSSLGALFGLLIMRRLRQARRVR